MSKAGVFVRIHWFYDEALALRLSLSSGKHSLWTCATYVVAQALIASNQVARIILVAPFFFSG